MRRGWVITRYAAFLSTTLDSKSQLETESAADRLLQRPGNTCVGSLDPGKGPLIITVGKHRSLIQVLFVRFIQVLEKLGSFLSELSGFAAGGEAVAVQESTCT